MKLRLEIYPGLALLVIRGDVKQEDIPVLEAGVRKLHTQEIKWIFLDASLAVMGMVDAQRLLAVRSLLSQTHVEIVTPYELPDTFRTIDGALSVCTARIALTLKEKLLLERKLGELEDQLNFLKLQFEAYERLGKSIAALNEQKQTLKSLVQTMTAGFQSSGINPTSAKPLQLKTDSQALQNLLEAKKDWIVWLKKHGVLY